MIMKLLRAFILFVPLFLSSLTVMVSVASAHAVSVALAAKPADICNPVLIPDQTLGSAWDEYLEVINGNQHILVQDKMTLDEQGKHFTIWAYLLNDTSDGGEFVQDVQVYFWDPQTLPQNVTSGVTIVRPQDVPTLAVCTNNWSQPRDILYPHVLIKNQNVQ